MTRKNTAPLPDRKQWVLVTGGSRGIGAGIVQQLNAAGFNVAFTYQKSAELACALAQALHGAAAWCETYACDVSRSEEVQALAKQLMEKHGAPYAVINNAGQTRDALLLRMTPEHWHSVIDTNLNSIYYVTHAFLEAMLLEENGCIVSIGSVSALRGNIGQTNYAATKAAVLGFSKSLATEVGRFNIRVNVIAPGIIESDMTQSIPENLVKKWRPLIPLRKFGGVTDVALMVEFLLGPGGNYITGQCFAIDGGLTA